MKGLCGVWETLQCKFQDLFKCGNVFFICFIFVDFCCKKVRRGVRYVALANRQFQKGCDMTSRPYAY